MEKPSLTPNTEQDRLIRSTEGTYLVDAGAGTGKTFTVTRRYSEIVSQDGVEPDDILLITFTRNAAEEMKNRIVAHSDYGIRSLGDAPIQTFHSLCNDILDEHGFYAPSYLGIDDGISDATQVLENETVEEEHFADFVGRFNDEHPEYNDFFRCLSEPTELLGLLKNLASKGVLPTADGWYRNSARDLEGDFEGFREAFDRLNRPRNDGSKQSELRSKLGRYGGNKCYLPGAPEKEEVRGERGSKSVHDGIAERAFDEDRERLFSFVHDLYFEYLRFALRRNYLNFGFLQMFTFVLLCENSELRESLEFDYVTVDEFQDTSAVQFKIALLLAGTDNFCVVGDWKQSIYSFQYADVANITEFEERLRRFKRELNDDAERVGLSCDVTEIELETNYRSTQKILDFAENALVTPASSRESVGRESILERVVSLLSDTDSDHSRIEAFRHEDETEAVLTKIQEVVGNEEYAVRVDEEDGSRKGDDEELRPPDYGDIAVLTRTRDFGRELLDTAEEHGMPVSYEGGVEIFRTDQAKLLLAWLRILESNSDRGWSVVLERAGYTLDEIDVMLDERTYPKNISSFRAELAELETVEAVGRRVFDRYGYDGVTADSLLNVVGSVYSSTTMTFGDLIRFIEKGVDGGATHEVQSGAGTDSVTVQTIHAAKGLEHPIVILANMNSGKFPPSGGSGGAVTYSELTGLRQRKIYSEVNGQPYVYDNWHYDVLRRCESTRKGEERRLLYVAMTRAEDHLLFSAGEEPNTFLEELPVEVGVLEPSLKDSGASETVQTRLTVPVPEHDGPETHSPHSLMNEGVYEEVDGGRGIEFGTAVHDFAEGYALGEEVEPTNEDEENVKEFVDSLGGELRVEEPAYLPLETDGKRTTVSGVVDLVHVSEDGVDIVDYKTDRGRHAEEEYRTQLSVYYHVIDSVYPEKDVKPNLFYTADATLVRIEPLTETGLREKITETSDYF